MNEHKGLTSHYSGRQIVAFLFKLLIAVAVFGFLALHTINFFTYTFKDSDWIYAPLGFGLTGVGAIGYLVVFLWDANTELKRVVALVMVFICTIGEVAAAGFGMQIEAWARQGWTFTQTDFQNMLWVVRILAFVHMIALVAYFAGDQVVDLFSDKRGQAAAAPTTAATTVRTTPVVGMATEVPAPRLADPENPQNGRQKQQV